MGTRGISRDSGLVAETTIGTFNRFKRRYIGKSLIVEGYVENPRLFGTAIRFDLVESLRNANAPVLSKIDVRSTTGAFSTAKSLRGKDRVRLEFRVVKRGAEAELDVVSLTVLEV